VIGRPAAAARGSLPKFQGARDDRAAAWEETSVNPTSNAATIEIREVTTQEVLQIQRIGSPIVDVREPEEFADGHIPGAVNIPLGRLEVEVDTHPAVVERALRERPVVVYCLSGGRSARAAATLHRRGFTNPVSLAGGILAWAGDGHPVAVPG
jgi:rhodanese-related sulfurtransferase